MLPLQFFGQNLNFALNLFFSLVTFATCWLYFDAWLTKRKFAESFKWLGFLLLSISFLLQAVLIEKSVLGSSIFGSYPESLSGVIRAAGYVILIATLLKEPLPLAPKNPNLNIGATNKGFLGPLVPGFAKVFLPLGAFIISILYFRKAMGGMERHLRQVGLAFLALGASETLALASLLRNTTNINLSNLVAPFGPVWALEKAALFVATVILGRWVWGYLIKRLQSQLFIIFTSSILIVFLVVSVTFTFLLVKNIETKLCQI